MVNLKIQFSRHARRRMKLYNLSEGNVSSVILNHNPELDFPEGKQEIISEKVLSGHGYPIKVVLLVEKDCITVITAYPLKKGLR